MLKHRRSPLVITAGLSLLMAAAAAAIAPTVFVPDSTFTASSLTGWHVLGQAQWTARNGEITGRPASGGKGGWLVLDKSFQDVGFFASFQCTGGCRTGVLLRAEKTASGMKGVYMSLNDGDVAAYRVTLDAQGQEISREKLRPGGGQMRIAPPVDPAASAAGRGGGRGGVGRGGNAPPDEALPMTPPPTGLRPNDWNQIEIILDANIIRPFLNEGGSGNSGGVADEEFGRYGPIAL